MSLVLAVPFAVAAAAAPLAAQQKPPMKKMGADTGMAGMKMGADTGQGGMHMPMPIPMPAGIPMFGALKGLTPPITPFLPGAGVDPSTLPMAKRSQVVRMTRRRHARPHGHAPAPHDRGAHLRDVRVQRRIARAAHPRAAERDDRRPLPQPHRLAEHRALARAAPGQSLRRRAGRDAAAGGVRRQLPLQGPLPRRGCVLVPPARQHVHRAGDGTVRQHDRRLAGSRTTTRRPTTSRR